MMASALMDGIVSKKVVSSAASIWCSDTWEQARVTAAGKGYHATPENAQVCKNAKSAIIIAVKPNVVEQVCADIASVESDALIISIAAGVTLATLEKNLPGRKVVRVMPNTPCLVGEAAAGYALGSLATEEDKVIVTSIFGSVGLAVEVKEILLDAVTGELIMVHMYCE